jgi:hypothetical protein
MQFVLRIMLNEWSSVFFFLDYFNVFIWSSLIIVALATDASACRPDPLWCMGLTIVIVQALRTIMHACSVLMFDHNTDFNETVNRISADDNSIPTDVYNVTVIERG